MKSRSISTKILMLLALGLAPAGGCGDGTKTVEPAPDAPPDSPPPPDCYTNPTTHEEIINACTTAQSVEKEVDLPLLNEDGSLPPLP